MYIAGYLLALLIAIIGQLAFIVLIVRLVKGISRLPEKCPKCHTLVSKETIHRPFKESLWGGRVVCLACGTLISPVRIQIGRR